MNIKSIEQSAVTIIANLDAHSLSTKWEIGGLLLEIKKLKGYDDNDACTHLQRVVFRSGRDYRTGWFKSALRIRRSYDQPQLMTLAKHEVPLWRVERGCHDEQRDEWVRDVASGKDAGPWKRTSRKNNTQTESPLCSIEFTGGESEDDCLNIAASVASAIKRLGYDVQAIYADAVQRVCR